MEQLMIRMHPSMMKNYSLSFFPSPFADVTFLYPFFLFGMNKSAID
jgi:hypothetical protein